MKNKRIADLSVITLILLVIVITILKLYFRNNECFEILSFVIEASLVGAIADWFAITALFEEPFLVGKIPIIASHTAIIPKNRVSIVNAVANMVQNELLSEKILRSKIEEINIVDSLIDFIDSNISTRSKLYKVLVDYFIERINNVDTIKFASYLEICLKQKIETINISNYLDEGISYSLQRDEFNDIFNIILDTVIEYVNRNSTKNLLEKFASEFVEKEANSLLMEKIIGILKSVNAINTSDITISILNQGNKILLNLKNKDDLLRQEIIEQISQLLKKVGTNDEIKSDIENWKLEVIEEISLRDYLNTIIKYVIKIIIEKKVSLKNNSSDNFDILNGDLLNEEGIISVVKRIKSQLKKHWDGLKNDHVNKNIIDKFIKESIFKFIESKYKNVGDIVKQVLNNMDDKSLNNFIKQKAGNDLHGIRLNGCIIGALFGGVVFIVTHLIYDFVLPNIFNIKF